MKSLLIMALALVASMVIVVFLPLSGVAISILVGMIGANALMAIVFALMAKSMS